MFIQVKGYLTFRKLIPERRMEFPEQGATLRSLLAALRDEIGEEFQVWVFDEAHGGLQRSVAVLVNGHHYTRLPTCLETLLQDGNQIIAIFPPIAGG
jgi:molybdopterin converting factor small subunit